jgi:hypothetical protein
MASIHIGRGGTNLGAFSEDDVREGLRSGRFFLTDLGWREGMEKWQPLSTFAEFAVTPPPLAPDAALAGTTPVQQSVAQPEMVEQTLGLPWDDRREIGFATAFAGTVKFVLTDPTAAFTAMRREGGFSEPFLFYLTGAWLGGFFGLLYHALRFGVSGGNKDVPSFSTLVELTIFLPLIGIFVSAALSHFCLVVVGGANRPFEATFRTLCFAAGSSNVLQFVPLVGWLLAPLWGLALLTIGFAKVQEISLRRSFAAVLLPLVVILCGLALALFAYGFVHLAAP